MSILCDTVQKSTEESLLVKSYLMNKAKSTSAEGTSGSQIRRNFKMTMVFVRDINKPIKSIIKDYTVNAYMEPQFLSIKTIKPIKGKMQKIFWTDFNFIEGRAILKHPEIALIVNQGFLKLWRRFLTKINNYFKKVGKDFLQENCAYTLVSPNMKTKKSGKNLEGKILKDKYQAVMFCFPIIQDVNVFLESFEVFYTNGIIKNESLIDLQSFKKDDPKRVIYYTTDTGRNFMNNPEAWGFINKNGYIFTDINSSETDPYKFSWTFDQQTSCTPDSDPKYLRALIPKQYRDEYPSDLCCFHIRTDWVKRPVDEIICSIQANKRACQVEIRLMKATGFKKCVKKTVLEMYEFMEAEMRKKRSQY